MCNMAAVFGTPLRHLKPREAVNSCWSNTYCSPFNVIIGLFSLYKTQFRSTKYF